MNAINHVGFALNVKKGPLLAGEGGFGQVFGRGRGAHCYQRLLNAFAQFKIGFHNLQGQILGHRRADN